LIELSSVCSIGKPRAGKAILLLLVALTLGLALAMPSVYAGSSTEQNTVEPGPACEIACYSDLDCDDSEPSTIDVCNNDGECQAKCTNIFVELPCQPACGNDSDCDDLEPSTLDVCNNDGDCSASCVNIPKEKPVEVPENPVPENPVLETPEPELPGPEEPAPEEPILEDPVPEKPAPKKGRVVEKFAKLKFNIRAANGSAIRHNVKAVERAKGIVREIKKFGKLEKRELASRGLGGNSPDEVPEGLYSIELEVENRHLKKVVLENAVLQDQEELIEIEMLEDISTKDGTEVKSPFLLNPKLEFDSGLMQLEPPENTNTLLKCADWDSQSQECNGEWLVASSFVNAGEVSVEISPSDPVFGFADLTVINVQSYPRVGNTWDVDFTTIGTADLIVNAVLGTGFGTDLVFQSLFCGIQEFVPEESENQLLFPAFYCEQKATLSNLVLTTGKHALEFIFGLSKDYAYNMAWDTNNSSDFNVGHGFDFNYTKVTIDGNVMPDGETIIPNLNQPGGGLVGWWKLDSNAGGLNTAIDYSGFGNHGNYINGADSNGTWFFDRNAGFFDGANDYVNLGSSVGHEGADAVTVLMWAKFKNAQMSSTEALLGQSAPGPSNTILLRRAGHPYERMAFNVYTSGGSAGAGGTGAEVADTKWHHYAGTYDGASVKLYIDGVVKGSTGSITGSINSKTTDLTIGGDGGTSCPFPGEIAEVKIFNRALTAEEIRNEYGRSLRGTGLKTYYTFNDVNADGSAIVDQAGYLQDSNGLLVNGADLNAWGLWDTNALFLDGADDFVDVGNIGDINSVTAWIFPTDVNSWLLGLSSTVDVNIRDGVLGGTGWTDANYYVNGMQTTSITDQNEWIHIAITSATPVTVSDLNIGRITDKYFNGRMDELKFFTKNLTDGDIFRDYNAWTKADYYSEIKDMNHAATIQSIRWDALFGSEQLEELNNDVNLIGWWKMNDRNADDFVLDWSGNSEDGELQGNADLNGTGWDDTNALYLDGDNDYIEIPDHADFNTAELTVTAWFKIDHNMTGGEIRDIVTKWASGGAGQMWGLAIREDAGGGADVHQSSYTLKNSAGTSVTINTGLDPILKGKWYMATMTYDGTTLTGYFNGKKIGETTLAGSIQHGTQKVRIGVNGATENDFDGTIDEVRIYDRVLTRNEVQALYSAGANDLNVSIRACSDKSCIDASPWAEFDMGNRFHSLDSNVGLVLDMNFNDVNVNSPYIPSQAGVLDASGNENHGQLVGGADINAISYNKSRAGFFDGVDNAVHISSLEQPNNVSIAAWFKTDYTANTQAVFSRDRLDVYISTNQQSYAWFNDGSDHQITLTGSGLCDNSWHYIVFTYDGIVGKLHLDGVESNSAVGGNALQNFAGVFAIGIADTGTNPFLGSIDDVKVYNRALSAGEIMALYLQGDTNRHYVQYKAEFVHSDANFPIGYGYLNDVGVEYNTIPDANIWRIDANDATWGFPLFSYARDGNLTIDFNVIDYDNFDRKTAEVFFSTTSDYGDSNKIWGGLMVDGNRCETNLIDVNYYNLGQVNPNLMAYYKFDGTDSNADREFDFSGNANHGQNISGADNNAEGKWDTNAGFFDGLNDYISVNSQNNAMGISDAITETAWIKFEETFSKSAKKQDFTLLDAGSHKLYFDHTSGKLTFEAVNNVQGSWKKLEIGKDLNKIGGFETYDGNLFVGITDDSSPRTHIWTFDGTTTTDSAGTTPQQFEYIASLAVYDGNLFIGGGNSAGDGDIYGFDGANWNKVLDDGRDLTNSMAVYDGNLFAGMGNDAGEGDVLSYDGTNWNTSYDGAGTHVRSFVVYDGNLFAAIDNNVFTFDGASWTNIYTIANASIDSLVSLAVYDGNLFVGGGTTSSDGDIYAFDGTNWNLNYDGAQDMVYSMVAYDGNLFAAIGGYSAGEGDVLTYNGANWSTSFDGAGTGITTLIVYDGNLLAGENITEVAATDTNILSFGAGFTVSSTTSTWNAGQWYNVGVSYDGTTASIFVDGILENSKTKSISIDNSQDNLFSNKAFVGRATGSSREGGSAEFFQGLVEEFKVYDSALTAAEISHDYNLGLINKRMCSWDWNISGVAADANYYIGVQVNDSVGNADFNTTLYSLSLDGDNVSPDLNVSKIADNDDNAALPAFSYTSDGNLTIDFNVSDEENNRLTVNIEYSASNSPNTGTDIVTDLNLDTAVCPSLDWDTNVSQCSWDWNISGIPDNNYYIIIDLSDGTSSLFEATDNSFRVDNTVPDANMFKVEGNDVGLAMPFFSYDSDANLTIDFNLATGDANFDIHYADINYSTANTQGTGTVIAKNLRFDGNYCQTNLIGSWDNTAGSDVNLVGYWKFDSVVDGNLDRVFDYSGSELHGQYIGGADNNGEGKWDTNAGFFDGAGDYVAAPLNADNFDEFTVSMWFKATSDELADDGEMIAWGLSPGSGTNFMAINQVGTTIRYWADCDNKETSQTMVAGKWYHAAVTLSASDLWTFYLDGESLSSYQDNSTHCNQSSGDNIYLAYAAWGYFNGTIEGVKIYDKALTVEEISQDYNYGKRNYRKCSWDWNVSGVSDNNYFVNLLAKDTAGNTYFDASDKNFAVDNNAPVTVDNDFNVNWNNSDQNIELSCSDSGAGCRNLYYSVDDTNYQAAWGDANWGVSITTDGNFAVFYRSDDLADHNADVKLIYVAVDKTDPTASISSPSEGASQTSSSVTLEYSATDSLSGVASYSVKVDSGSWVSKGTSTSHEFTGQATGAHTYYAKAEDNAGNESSSASVSVTISSGTTTDSTEGDVSGSIGGIFGYPDQHQEGCVEAGFSCKAGKICCAGLSCVSATCDVMACELDSECGVGEACIDNACTKFFDIKIVRVDSPISKGEVLDFIYLVKNPLGEGTDVGISYWLERNGEKLVTGSEVIFVAMGEEKEVGADLHLPGDADGKYTFVIELLHGGKTTRATKDIEVSEFAPLNLDLFVSRLPAVIREQPVDLVFTVGSNWDARVRLNLRTVILKGNDIVWTDTQHYSIDVSKRVEQSLPVLEPGGYRIVVTAASGDVVEQIIRNVEVPVPEPLLPVPFWEILNTAAFGYLVGGFLLLIAVILSWHNLFVVRRLSSEHVVRRRAKLIYAVFFIVAFLALLAFALLVSFDFLERFALDNATGFLQTENGRILLDYLAIVEGRLQSLFEFFL